MSRKTKQYQFAAMPGSVLSASMAVVAGKELVRIEKKYGAITPPDVVRESRPKSAPLHEQFTWDNNEAAEQWRLTEARNIIRSVRIVEPDIPHQEQPVIRAMCHVQAHDKETKFEGPAYISMSRAMDSEAYRQQLLTQAKTELASWQHRYDDLLHFAGAMEAVTVLVDGIEHQLA